MRSMFCIRLLLVGACIATGLCAWGQKHDMSSRTPPSFEVAVTYDAFSSNTVPGQRFWMQGASAQAAYQFTHHWAGAAGR